MKKIKIDIRPMFLTLHNEWDGETGRTFKGFVKRKENKERIINKINELINNENIDEMKIDYDEREMTVSFNNFITLDEIYQITNRLTANDLIAYKTF